MRTLLVPILLLAAAPKTQQRVDPHPPGALVRLELDGPAKWEQHFAGTRVLELVRSKQFAEVFAPVQKRIDEQMAQAQKEAPLDVQAMRDGILAYAGRVRVAIFMEQGPDGFDGRPQIVGYIAAGPDGHTDLEVAGRELERVTLEGKASHVPVSLAGLEWLANAAGDVRGTVPRMVGEDLVMVFYSDGLEGQVEKLFTADPAKADADAGNAPLRAQIDASKFLDMVVAGAQAGAQRGGGVDPELVTKFLASLLGKIGQIGIQIGATDEFTDLTFDIELPGERGSLLALLAPPRTATPRLFALVPRQHESFACGPVDLGQIEIIIKQILELFPDAPMDWQGIEAAVEENAGVRLGPDVLAHLGDEYVWLTAPPSDDATEGDEFSAIFDAVNGVCFGLGLKDGIAFARAIETILDRTGALRMRKSEKYRDGEIHRLTLPIVAQKLYWSITDKMLAIGIGEQGLAHVQSLLDGAAMVARGEAPAAFQKELSERVAVVAPKYCSISFQTMVGTLDLFKSGLMMGEDEEEEPLEDIGSEDDPEPAAPTRRVGAGQSELQVALDVIDGVKKLLKAHRLEHAVSVTYHERDRVRQRMIW